MADKETKQIGDLKVEVDRTICSALVACVHEAPDAFVLGNDSIVTFKDNPQGKRDQILEAARSCPVGAIVVTDAHGKRLA